MHFEQGAKLTDQKLDLYNYLRKRLERKDLFIQPPIEKSITIEVDGETVIGEITKLERYYIEIEIVYPFVNWKDFRRISGPGRGSSENFLKTHREVSERILRKSYKKIRWIDERIDLVAKYHDHMFEELEIISSIQNKHLRKRLERKIFEWFYHKYLFTSCISNMIATISDRPQIDKILEEYKRSKRKIYLIEN